MREDEVAVPWEEGADEMDPVGLANMSPLDGVPEVLGARDAQLLIGALETELGVVIVTLLSVYQLIPIQKI